VRHFLQQALHKDPAQRPTALQLLDTELMQEVGLLQADLQNQQLRDRFMAAYVRCWPEYLPVWDQLKPHLVPEQAEQQQQQQPSSVLVSLIEDDAKLVERGQIAVGQQMTALASPPQLAVLQRLQVRGEQQAQLFGIDGSDMLDMVPMKDMEGVVSEGVVLNVPEATRVLQQQRPNQQ
jgi:hypothetical protein